MSYLLEWGNENKYNNSERMSNTTSRMPISSQLLLSHAPRRLLTILMTAYNFHFNDENDEIKSLFYIFIAGLLFYKHISQADGNCDETQCNK